MNKQGPGKIDWTDYTWNPVTGCKHDCSYCYAHRIAERFHLSFEPTFHPERLEEPFHAKKPSKIFVCSNADLFGDWVMPEWVEAVLAIVRQCPQHTFQFLTKAPHNLARWNPWPPNAWVGATVTNQMMLEKTLSPLEDVEATVRFLCAEPLLGDIEFWSDAIEWLIIGALTGPGGWRPLECWVYDLLRCASKTHIPVWIKDSVFVPTRIKEWPGAASTLPDAAIGLD